jgi:endonuclease/exonuclease/phosphatase family metal-dependent hydrolase
MPEVKLATLSGPDRDIPIIVCGDINDGPGFDASERQLGGSGIEDLMGSVWKSELTLGNALYDALPEKKRTAIDLSSIRTTSYRDPIFDRFIKVWIDHILYSRQHGEWVKEGKVHDEMPSGAMIWDEFPHASDHHPVSAVLNVP